MSLLAIDTKVYRDLWRMRGQFLAIAVVIGCGVGVYLGMRATMHSLLDARARYYAQERFGHIFAGLTRAPERVADEVRALPGVQAAQTRVVQDVNLDVPDMDEVVTGRLVSIPDSGRPSVNDLRLRRGRMPRDGRALEVVASEAFAEAHGFPLGTTIEAILDGKRVDLRMVGVALAPEYTYSLPPGLLVPDDRRFGVLWIRRAPLAAAFDLEGAFNDISLRIARDASTTELIERLDDILDRYGGLGAIDRSDQSSAFFISNELKQLDTFSYFTPVMFLTVAAFLLNIVLGRLVAGQRTEIAALKAFGYRDREVGLHYAKLVGLVVLLGWGLGNVVGLLIGEGMTAMYAEYYRFPDLVFRLRFRESVEAIAFAVVGAGVGVWGSLRRTVNLAPADALRPEAPPIYEPTVFERIGLDRYLPTAPRMILRELERRPGRAMFTGLGVAFATGLTIAMAFSLDSMKLMLNHQYGLSDREDVQLTFTQPRDLRVVRELEAMPGVLHAEPYRAVAVKLRSGRRSKNTSIIGIPPEGQLLALLDEDRNRVPIPPEGVVIPSKLADILQARVGATLHVEVLEGARPHREVQVARIIDSYVGIGAHMDLLSLSRMLMETVAANQARLLMDDSRMPELHRAVKETPLIAGLTARDTVLRRVRELLDQNLGVFVSVSLGFSLVMAFGVLYNVVRITVSERSRELATLRVLGFRRKEVATILFGEMGIVLAGAIPAGLLVGYGLSLMLAHSPGFNTEQFRLPFKIDSATYAMAVVNVLVAALISAWSAWRKLEQFDIVEVLKTRD